MARVRPAIIGNKGNSSVTENPYSPTADSFTLSVIHRKNKTNFKQERNFYESNSHFDLTRAARFGSDVI